MQEFLTFLFGRLRLLAFLEGISLLVLVFVAVPMKRMLGDPSLVQALGPAHGGLFLLFVFNALRVGVEEGWKFSQTTWKVLLACVIPFGSFCIDWKILSSIHAAEAAE